MEAYRPMKSLFSQPVIDHLSVYTDLDATNVRHNLSVRPLRWFIQQVLNDRIFIIQSGGRKNTLLKIALLYINTIVSNSVLTEILYVQTK